MNEHSKLEGISKSNPTTQENLESQVLNKGDDSQDLVKYLLVQLADNEGKQQMSPVMRKPTMWFPNRPDTNRAVQAQKMVRGWKF